MTKGQARERMSDLENEYGYSDTWPLSCQREFERLCEIIYKRKQKSAK